MTKIDRKKDHVLHHHPTSPFSKPQSRREDETDVELAVVEDVREGMEDELPTDKPDELVVDSIWGAMPSEVVKGTPIESVPLMKGMLEFPPARTG